MSFYKKYINRAESNSKKHPRFNAIIHGLGGIAIGILITHPFVDPHPLQWAAVFGGLSILGHIYIATAK